MKMAEMYSIGLRIKKKSYKNENSLKIDMAD